MTGYQAKRHPVATVIVFMIFGPLLLAAGMLAVVAYVLGVFLSVLFGRSQ